MKTSHHRNTRTSVFRTASLLLTAALVATGLAACGGDSGPSGSGTLAAIEDRGVVRIGVAEFLPTTGADGNTPTGIFPEEAAAVFAEMGVDKVEIVKMDFGALIPSLQSGRIDVAAGGLYVNPERCKAVSFATPNFGYLEAMAVPKGNPKQITTYRSVADAGAKLGVISGAAEIPLAKAEGVDDAKIQKYPDLPSLLDAVKAGRVDAAAYDNVTIAYFVARPAYSGLESTEPYGPGTKAGAEASPAALAFGKDAEELTAAYDTAREKLAADGTIDGIYDKWSVPPVNRKPGEGVTLETACAGA